MPLATAPGTPSSTAAATLPRHRSPIGSSARPTERRDTLFVSTVSVYKSPAQDNDRRNRRVKGRLKIPTTEEITGETYGPLKVLCEMEVERAFGDRAFIVRPGLIMGPYDPTNRFTHWAERIGNESPVLVPALRDQPMQLIDARDLGAWMLLGLKNGLGGQYNAAGPDTPKTFGDMLDACHAQNPGSEFVWIKEDDFETHGLKMWQDLPLTLSSDPAEQGMLRMDNRKAIAAGLRFRPWADTARDVLAWVRSPDPKPKPTHGLERSKELEIIAMLGSSA